MKKCRILEKDIVGRLLFLILGCVLCFSTKVTAEYQENSKIQDFIKEVSNIENGEFFEWKNANISKQDFLTEETKKDSFSLYYVNNDDEYLGYFIWDDKNNHIAEYSKEKTPYEKFASLNNLLISGIKCKYSYANYSIEYDDQIIYIDESGFAYENILKDNAKKETMLYTTVLPGVTPQLQGKHICTAAAVSNLLWYYGQHGYGDLISGISFEKMKDEITALFNSSELFSIPGFRNVNIPKVIYTYVKRKNRYYSSVSNVIKSPTINNVIAQIDMSRPCLVGFKAGSTYSKTQGHMTACFGYQYIGGVYQVVLADGHSSKLVYKTWTKYNDYVITVNISK